MKAIAVFSQISKLWNSLCQKQVSLNIQFLQALQNDSKFSQIKKQQQQKQLNHNQNFDDKLQKDQINQDQNIQKKIENQEQNNNQNGKTQQLLKRKYIDEQDRQYNQFSQNVHLHLNLQIKQKNLNNYSRNNKDRQKQQTNQKMFEFQNQVDQDKEMKVYYHQKLKLNTEGVKIKDKLSRKHYKNILQGQMKDKFQLKNNSKLQLFQNQQLNQKFNLNRNNKTEQEQTCEQISRQASQICYLPTHKLKFNKLLERSTQINKKSRLSRLKLKHKTKRRQLLQQEEIRKSEELQRIQLQQKITQERLKRIYFKKNQLHQKLEALNKEVIILKEKQKKQLQFKRKLQKAGEISSCANSRLHLVNSEKNSYFYNNPENRKKSYFKGSLQNKSLLNIQNKKESSMEKIKDPSKKIKNIKCKTQQQENQIQKSRNAIQFILQIRKRERQRRAKLQLSIKNSKQKERILGSKTSKNSDFSKLQQINRQSVLLPTKY